MSNEMLPPASLRHDGAIVVRVFVDTSGPRGGNPAPVWSHADGMDGNRMQALAHAAGHESAFVQHCHDGVHQWHMRYFVPNHEMEMCGHATLGALWLLHRQGRWGGEPTAIRTLSGTVHALLGLRGIEISQPRGSVSIVSDDHRSAIASCLGISTDEIAGSVLTASTSRPKTLVRLASVGVLNTLAIAADQVQGLCDRIGSTGLYPYALRDGSGTHCSARQFPRSSGYVEDAATGIAAAALAWGLRHQDLLGAEETTVVVRQGEAMGSPSLIRVRLPSKTDTRQLCWLGGEVRTDNPHGEERQP